VKSEERREKRDHQLVHSKPFKTVLQLLNSYLSRRVDSALAKKMMLDTASCLDPAWISPR
jgi:hypothetical protein